MAPHSSNSSTLAGKSHGRRSLVDCSSRGRQESDTTECFIVEVLCRVLNDLTALKEVKNLVSEVDKDREYLTCKGCIGPAHVLGPLLCLDVHAKLLLVLCSFIHPRHTHCESVGC